ncbi:hypothetical protein VTL71DRAFT_13670 [Oculimacula yallundae]|uniref:Uncharacterized protein n=1 Tax=Oculimacula yallundae TaxID=86028 RepID=A0ABR4CL46_9HELO
MSQTDELFFTPGPQPPRLGAAMDAPPWLNFFTEPLNGISRNTANIAYDTAQTNLTLNAVNAELRDANNVLERLQIESQNHSTALLFIVAKEEAIIATLQRTATAAAEQQVQAAVHAQAQAQAQELEHSIISDILRWTYSLSFASCVFLIWVAFVFLMVWYRATARDVRSSVLGVYDLPVNSTSALEINTVLFRNPNWRTLLNHTRQRL